MRTIVAHSEAIETEAAARELIERASPRLEGAQPKAGILFASVDYDHAQLLRALREAWPELPLIGGTSDGEISSELGFCHDSVLLTLFAGDDLKVHAGLGRELSADIDQAVASAMGDSAHDVEPALCISIFAPSTNSSEVVRCLNRRLQPDCPVLGGLTGDHREFMQTKEFFGEEVLTDSLPVLLISGDFSFGWGIGSGWFPIGKRYQVTKSDGHLVYEIDHRPAIGIYQDHYGSVPEGGLSEYPVAIFSDVDEEDWSLRAILDSDSESGYLRFAGEVREGATVSMTEVLPEGLLGGSTSSLENALQAFEGEAPELALVFSCAARKWVLGTQAAQEIDLLRSCAVTHGVPDLQVAGLYVFGEISPPNGGGESCFHNETCVSLVIGK